ncbi:uncharacterized protein LOC109841555 [Asparagus officinalis]|uniref:uncharacterized protein LOC109841555 n=1 Tax=Asparagus officinalis TaxID=4686 RepID=UPI00098E6576|nr:uncharacterized protein LOC109841555 [Asparagus officinalis]
MLSKSIFVLFYRIMSSEGQGSTRPPTSKPGGKDPCWLYGERVGSDTSKVKCKYYTQILNGGISRFKQHLAGKRGNCAPCVKVPDDVKAKVSKILDNAKKSRDEKEMKMHNLLSEVHIGEDEEDNSISLSSQRSSSSSHKVIGPMDSFAARSPEEIAQIVAKGKQPMMDSKLKKKKREDVLRYVSKWFYEAGIPFHTATLPSFHQMLQAIGLFGSHLQAPLMYELSETCLQKEVDETKEIVENFKRTCVVNGCSIMTDAWSDRKSRSIMNIVVHSAGRACFLSSHDASADKHDAKYIFDFVDKAIDQIGEANVIQIVTDGASNNMAASKLLLEKRPNIFWTTCAAHTVNLMLCDIAKIKPIRNAILMGRSVSVFIYNHTKPLQLFREFTKGDLVRPGVTRFATAFLSLQSLRDHKKEMRQMFISDKWTDCSLSRTPVGKNVAEIIASNKFWDNIDFALKVFTPLVKVLRRADGDKIGSMGFIYGDMLVAKEELKVALGDDEKKYNPILEMIKPRFKKNLCETLHKAGYFLNPFYYYPAYTEIENDGSFMNAIVKCMHRLFPFLNL